MLVKYVGPHAHGVVLADTGQLCELGQVVDVYDQLGESLCSTDAFERVVLKSKKSTPAAAGEKE